MAEVSRLFTAWTVVVTSGAGTSAVATKAGIPKQRHFVTSISVSGSAAPAATVLVTLADSSGNKDAFQLPAAAFAPVIPTYNQPIRCATGSDVTLTIPGLGGAVVATAVLKGYTITE